MSVPTTDRAAIKTIIDALVEDGHQLHGVHDGEDLSYVATDAEALEIITAVDVAVLYVVHREGGMSWVMFVLGNDPREVAADHTTDLGPVLDPLTKDWWADE